MLDELEVWEHIFLEKDEDRLGYLIRMVVTDECAREYVLDKLIELKNKPTEKIEINIDGINIIDTPTLNIQSQTLL